MKTWTFSYISLFFQVANKVLKLLQKYFPLSSRFFFFSSFFTLSSLFMFMKLFSNWFENCLHTISHDLQNFLPNTRTLLLFIEFLSVVRLSLESFLLLLNIIIRIRWIWWIWILRWLRWSSSLSSSSWTSFTSSMTRWSSSFRFFRSLRILIFSFISLSFESFFRNTFIWYRWAWTWSWGISTIFSTAFTLTTSTLRSATFRRDFSPWIIYSILVIDWKILPLFPPTPSQSTIRSDNKRIDRRDKTVKIFIFEKVLIELRVENRMLCSLWNVSVKSHQQCIDSQQITLIKILSHNQTCSFIANWNDENVDDDDDCKNNQIQSDNCWHSFCLIHTWLTLKFHFLNFIMIFDNFSHFLKLRDKTKFVCC